MPLPSFCKRVAGFIKAHDIGLDKYDFDKFVGGHLTRLGTKNDVVIQKEFIDDLNILENWLRVSSIPYKHETNNDVHNFIIQHDMSRNFSFLIKELYRHILEDIFKIKSDFTISDHTLYFGLESEPAQHNESVELEILCTFRVKLASYL